MRPLGRGFQRRTGGRAPTAELARVGRPRSRPRSCASTETCPGQPPPTARPGTIAGTLAQANMYAHGGYPELVAAIARVRRASPARTLCSASGADNLIMLCARAYAGSGRSHRDRRRAHLSPLPASLPAQRVRRSASGEAVLTYQCRPNNPTGALDEISAARPLVVDEAYYEYCGDTAAGLISQTA